MIFPVLMAALINSATIPMAASPYQLIQFENSEFRDYTPAELIGLIGSDAQYLPEYGCDGKHEFQLFTPLDDENPNADSLTVRSASGRTYVYRDGAMDPQAAADSDPFVAQAIRALAILESRPSAARLLSLLERSRYPVEIARGGNRFDPHEVNGRSSFGIQEAQVLVYLNTLRKADSIIPFHQLGVGGTVNWDPTGKYLARESDGELRPTLPEIALSHELYHAYDSIRGLLDQRMVDGAAYEFEPVLEYRGVYFENRIRAESNVRYRRNYDSNIADANAPSLLDADGNPVLIPSACLASQHVF